MAKSSAQHQMVKATAGSEAFQSRLKLAGAGKPTYFDHATAAAHPFLTAVALTTVKSRTWIICDDLRSQERVHADLAIWHPQPATFFPEMEHSGIADALPDQDLVAERLAALQSLAEKKNARTQVIVLNIKSLDEDVPTSASLKKRQLELKVGQQLDLVDLSKQLSDAGYDQVPQVSERGDFAIRGGIIDIYSLHSYAPVRIELFDDELESIREFEIDSQASTQRIDSCRIMFSSQKVKHCKLADYIGKSDTIIAVENEPEDNPELRDPQPHFVITTAPAPGSAVDDQATASYESPLGGFEAGDFVLQEAKRKTFTEQIETWASGGWSVAMFFNNEGEIERFHELIDPSDLPRNLFQALLGDINHGFTIPSAQIAVISDAELFGRYQHARARRLFNREKNATTRRAQADFRELTEGDLVVHMDYGIARYEGLIEMGDDTTDTTEEVLVLEYADEARLYVPLEQAHLVSRYVGSGKNTPHLNKLGGNRWQKTKASAQRAILDYAAQLLSVQAERDTHKAYSHPPDTKWQLEFENAFIYTETTDQMNAIEESKSDMEKPQPMDRLICGDVGFGKTEVAIRTAFKAVMGGRQVAMLAPTTVLAQQHYNNLRERMSDYPVTIDLLSRYRTPKQQRETVKKIKQGAVDIVIGTHRLISKDIEFKKLGLVVIDEEQRFGVKHKERFKQMFRLVDVLTLSATPIPRTLYLSLMGARDMSTIDTPPPNRYPVETTICGYDEGVIKKALKRELDRRGQVFFLHNRVGTIEKTKELIEQLAPGARVGIGHGQMEEGVLEQVMKKFIDGQTDVLVCTTIIESGVDIPNANTIIIDRADRFGLADLYQLRGRVGRAGHKAYAILMLPPDLLTTGDAKKRINAIRQYSELGAGFKIAMRDLEIRGAGNLLGTQQSGHILAIGFDMYCKLLKGSIASISGKPGADRIDVALRIDFICSSEAEFLQTENKLPAFIPATFLPEATMRINAYKMIAELDTLKEFKALIKNWRDRFGKIFPEPVDNLLRCTELKLVAAHSKISSVEILDRKLMLTRNGDYVLISGKFPRLVGKSQRDILLNAIDMVKKF